MAAELSCLGCLSLLCQLVFVSVTRIIPSELQVYVRKMPWHALVVGSPVAKSDMTHLLWFVHPV
jgi:hypothetical protein